MMTLSEWALAASKLGVWLRHANAVKRGRVPQRALNYGMASLLARLARRLYR